MCTHLFRATPQPRTPTGRHLVRKPAQPRAAGTSRANRSAPQRYGNTPQRAPSLNQARLRSATQGPSDHLFRQPNVGGKPPRCTDSWTAVCGGTERRGKPSRGSRPLQLAAPSLGYGLAWSKLLIPSPTSVAAFTPHRTRATVKSVVAASGNGEPVQGPVMPTATNEPART